MVSNHYSVAAAAWLNTVVPEGIEVSVDEGGVIEVREADGGLSEVLPGDGLFTKLWILLSEVQDVIQMSTHEQWPDPTRSAIPEVDITDEGVTVGYTRVPAPMLTHPIEFRTSRTEPWLISHWISAP